MENIKYLDSTTVTQFTKVNKLTRNYLVKWIERNSFRRLRGLSGLIKLETVA